MPIYEYKCTKCNSEFEKFQSINDDTVPSCDACGGNAKKLISRSSFHLKGSGWYVTDYGGKKPSFGDSAEESSSESTTETKTSDDKPAATSESSESKSE